MVIANQIMHLTTHTTNQNSRHKNQSQVEICCIQQYRVPKLKVPALKPHKFDRKMQKFFKGYNSFGREFQEEDFN